MADSSTPSQSLLDAFRPSLVRHPPFTHMARPDVDFFIQASEQRYYAPGEVLVAPDHGPVEAIHFIREGAVTGVRGAEAVQAFAYEAGDLFPLGAAVGHRPVTATYRATADTFTLVLPRAAMTDLAARSPAFADFLTRRVARFLELSRQELQKSFASQVLAEQSLETPLGELAAKAPVTCAPETPLREALGEMVRRRIGSILVTDAEGGILGILTRYDVLGRVTLPGVPLDAPIRDVMVSPVHTLTATHTAQEAALLMSRHGIRHVPVTRDGRAIGIVSERDLFAMHRTSLKQVSTALRAAADVPALKAAAADIRRFARSLLGQGVHARQLTGLISHLNDVLTQRLLELLAPRHGVALDSLCWLALGSEGRGEQTIATDQDNAVILAETATPADREAALALGRAVNQALADCGYPLCKGGIMAGEPACCLRLDEWRDRFLHWVAQGSPEDLLNASIYFDLRALAGDARLAQSLQATVLEATQATPRFLKQMALNALERPAPLNWLGAIDVDAAGEVDLKLQGTALYVDGARLYALQLGVAVTGTRDRLEAVGPGLGVPPSEFQAWVAGFEFLQMLRLRHQLESAAPSDAPNRIRLADLNDIDRRMLKESFHQARQLQQRLQLDYAR